MFFFYTVTYFFAFLTVQKKENLLEFFCNNSLSSKDPKNPSIDEVTHNEWAQKVTFSQCSNTHNPRENSQNKICLKTC